MDPLSITAAIISVGQAADGLLRVIRQFNSASREIESFRSEITRLKLVLDITNSTLAHKEPTAHNADVCAVLADCAKIVGKMEDICVDRKRTDRHVSKLAWMKNRGKVDVLRRELRDAVGLLTLIVVVKSSSCQSTARQLCSHGGAETALTNFHKPSGIHSTVLGQESSLQYCWAEHRNKSSRGGTPHRYSTPGALQLRNSRSSNSQIKAEFCAQSCPCHCHRNECQHLYFTNEYLGTLFISRTRTGGTMACNYRSCVRNPIPKFSLLYYGYRGAWIPSLAFKYSNPGRPHISLSFPRVLPPDSEFLQCIRSGDLERIKELLSSGEATAADIQGPHGLTTLNLAMVHGQDEVAKLLISEGAPQIPPNITWAPSDVLVFFASYSLVSSSMSTSSVVDDDRRTYATELPLKEITTCISANGLESAHLSRLHKSILGLSSEDIENIGVQCKPIINETDYQHRTALFWAASLNKPHAVLKLLLCGADPDIADVNGSTPLHAAASTGAVECIKHLSSAGADLESRNRSGTTPLQQASSQGHGDTISALIQLGADIRSKNYFGEAALSYAIQGRQVGALRTLVELGADLEDTNSWGYVPVLDATLLDSHEGLQFLLSRGLGLDRKIFDGKTLLHIAALSSDVRTMEILMQADLGELDAYAVDDDGCTPMDYLRKRKNSDGMVEVFGALLLSAGTARGK